MEPAHVSMAPLVQCNRNAACAGLQGGVRAKALQARRCNGGKTQQSYCVLQWLQGATKLV
jgi:hypothetical protein